MRVRQAVVISQTMQSVERAVLESWLNLNGEAFEKFVKEVCGWTVEGSSVSIPLNKENEARGTVVRENVKFDRKLSSYCNVWKRKTNMILQNSRE